jgi:NADPH-dependent 2,4-dienoyl-CoA reductase/sulfur reductase-like enzyme
VSCAGRIRDPEQAEALLAAGQVDLVQMARALIADPEWPQKAAEGRVEDIRPCLYVSSGCYGRLYRGLPISCVQNPAVGRERELAGLTGAPRPRRVVVVGGGPAGMETARVAAERGHAVVLFEREDRLGGQIRTAARAPGRGELLRGVAWLERQLARAGVDVRLGIEADRERVLGERPDAVVVATGSDPAGLDIPGGADPRVVSVREVLDGRVRPGQRVVVVDGLGRLAAASAADHLATAGHEVTLVARDYAVGFNIDHTTRPAVERRLREGGVRFVTGTEVIAFSDGGVEFRDCFTGRLWRLEGIATLVHDVGGRARDALADALAGAGPEVLRVGDGVAPRGLEEAYHEGFQAGLAL